VKLTASLAIALALAATPLVVRAGDALAIGYNADGVWTAAIYYCSSTPPGGKDYKNEAEARDAAIRDLKTRTPEGIVKTAILSSSDRTGNFAYARGKTQGGKTDLHAIGFGETKQQAEEDALRQLAKQGAKLEQKIIYNYFSHGADAHAASAKK
jgi:hypothetical protein